MEFDYRNPPRLAKPVFFVGFMGSGKTSVARRLARTCHIASVDVDTFIERREQKKIKEIFAEQGEARFRFLELSALNELVKGDPLLVSCGGGIVTVSENREFLKRNGFVVYLKISAKEAASRISNLSTRPLFQNKENADKINQERAPLYEDVADVSIDTSGKRIERIASEVQDILQKEGILCP